MSLRLLAFCLVASLPAAPLLNAQDNPPVIKMTTRQVQISVVVHDKQGQPVADLKREDFTIYDKGQPQQIRYFVMETDQAPPAHPPKLLPGVFDNRTIATASQTVTLPNALTVILIDSLNSDFIGRAMARNGIVKFLGQLQPGDRVAIYSLADGLEVIHEFTSDISSLIGQVDKQGTGSAAVAASSHADANTGNAAVDRLVNRASAQVSNFYQERRAQTTLEALETIANHVAGVPGRKNLIWLSGGFPLFVGTRANGAAGRDFQSFDAETQQTLRALNNAQVAIYPVDIGGLMTSFDFNPSMAQPDTPSGMMQRPIPGRSGVDRRATQDIIRTQATMYEVADRTGGRAFLNTNDITGSIRSAISDTAVSYTMAFTPTHNEWDGRYREIRLKVDRPGVEVRCRTGYYATPEAANDANDVKIRAAAMRTARDSALLSTGLGVAAQVQQFPSAAAPHLKVRFVLDANDLSFTQDAAGAWIADLDVLTVVRDRQGATLKELPDRLKLRQTQEQHQRSLKAGIPLNADLEAPVQSVSTRVVVRDAATGAVGSVDLPLAK
jgi:VWFA-related protein